MKTNETHEQAPTLDSESLAKDLKSSAIKPHNSAEFERVGAEVAQRALTRTTWNQCGGLPGLPAPRRSLIRRLINRLARRTN